MLNQIDDVGSLLGSLISLYNLQDAQREFSKVVTVYIMLKEDEMFVIDILQV